MINKFLFQFKNHFSTFPTLPNDIFNFLVNNRIRFFIFPLEFCKKICAFEFRERTHFYISVYLNIIFFFQFHIIFVLFSPSQREESSRDFPGKSEDSALVRDLSNALEGANSI